VPPADVKFEIGHVLFIDIVGYSKLLITEQSEQIETLKQIVRGTEQFRLAEAERKLLRLPTGDGGPLVFRTSPEAPVKCAVEISRELKCHPELRVRMGIHSGPVNEISDLNEQANIAGAGINIAQRVMNAFAINSSLSPFPYVSAASNRVMPRSNALSIRAIASPSVKFPHQPVEIVHKPKPTSLTVRSVFL